jgi:DNA-binding NarL/FixJ family response regulator
MNKKLKVFIVDDHALFREGVCYLLSNNGLTSEIREAKNGREFLAGLNDFVPDVVFMDIEMPEMNGMEATQAALKRFPGLKIIALSMYSDENFYTEMIEAGVKGFLLKNSKFDELKNALADVFEGRNYFSPEILASIVNNLNRKPETPANNNLTKREMEVLLSICQGHSNHEIAEQLFISKRTVDKHRENILLKTQSRNTAELVVFAIKEGYFEV